MMPVESFTEPVDFDIMVRQKGALFLSTTPQPTSKQWNTHAFWQQILPEMSNLYNRLCNYCSTWIPHSTGQHSIDHFKDKRNNPSLAYEWSNYRYVSARFNSRKGKDSIIDPFGIQPETFILDFINFFIEVNPKLTDQALIQLAEQTIKTLKLNTDNILIEERANYYFALQYGEISFDYLKKQAPFIAYELNRQKK